MHEPNPFLQQIIDNPDDISARLIYSDWLKERGDPRGEFIEIQCELPNLDDTDDTLPGKERRQNELLYEHYRTWALPLSQRQEFKRGFVSTVDCMRPFSHFQEEKVRKTWEHAFASSPITSLRNWRPDIDSFHSRIQQLEYDSIAPSWQASLVSLFQNAWPPNLTALKLKGQITEHDFRELLKNSIQLKQLNEFSISFSQSNSLFDAEKSKYQITKFFETLSPTVKLQVGSPIIKRQLLFTDFIKSIGPRNLALATTVWNLDYMDLSILDESDTPQLVDLNINGYGDVATCNATTDLLNKNWTRDLKSLMMKGVLATRLFRSNYTPLTVLLNTGFTNQLENFYFHTESDPPIWMNLWLATLPEIEWPALRRLKITVSNSTWPEPSENPLIKFLETPPPNLRRLDLSFCCLGDREFKVMLRTPGIQQLTHLGLARNRLTNKSALELLESGPWENLVALDLSRNSIDSKIRKTLQEQFGTRIWNA